MLKLTRTPRFLGLFHKEHTKCSLLWTLGLDIPLDSVLVTIFVSHSFSCFIDLKLGNTISMATKWCHSISFLQAFKKKVNFHQANPHVDQQHIVAQTISCWCTLLLLLFAGTKFCEFGIPTILRVLNIAISRSRAKFCDSRNQR